MFISAKWAASAQKIKGYNNKYVRKKPSPIYFTEKQLKILDGEIPFEDIPNKEYDFLVEKLIKVGRISESERIREMKEQKLKAQELAKQKVEEEARNARLPKRTKAEAKQILHDLNPPWINQIRDEISTGNIVNLARVKERNTQKYREENRRRREEAAKHSFHLKPVNQYTARGEFIQRFPSVKAAAQEVGGTPGNLSSAAKSQRKAYGFLWSYAEKDE